jgi:HEAT repeat protein
MRAEEQLQVIEALTPALTDASDDIRKQALHCLVGFGPDGLGRIVDVLDDEKASIQAKCDAAHAIGAAFSEGKVDKSGIVKVAFKALEKALESADLCESAVTALGAIGPAAVLAKPKLLALLDGKRGNNALCVKIGAALLAISPIN